MATNPLIILGAGGFAHKTLDDESLLGGYFGYWGGVVRPMLNWTTVKTQ